MAPRASLSAPRRHNSVVLPGAVWGGHRGRYTIWSEKEMQQDFTGNTHESQMIKDMILSQFKIFCMIVAFGLPLFSFNNSALAQDVGTLPNTKGLRVEIASPIGYTTVRNRSQNQVLQFARQTERGYMYWLQLNIYSVPVEVVSRFKNAKPSQWADGIASMNDDNIVSAELAPINSFRAIDIVYDHDLLVGSEKWRNRNLMRTFEVAGRMVVAQCMVSVQYLKNGTQPPVLLLTEIRDQHYPECKAFLDGLKVTS